jgi:hypothetical protein
MLLQKQTKRRYELHVYCISGLINSWCIVFILIHYLHVHDLRSKVRSPTIDVAELDQHNFFQGFSELFLLT